MNTQALQQSSRFYEVEMFDELKRLELTY